MTNATFACDHCGAVYRRGNIAAGKKVRCKKCGEIITIPELEPEVLEELEELPELEAAPPSTEPSAPSPENEPDASPEATPPAAAAAASGAAMGAASRASKPESKPAAAPRTPPSPKVDEELASFVEAQGDEGAEVAASRASGRSRSRGGSSRRSASRHDSGRRDSSRRGSSGGRSARTADAGAPKSNTPMVLIAVAVVAVAGLGIWLATRGNGDDKGQGQTNVASGDNTKSSGNDTKDNGAGQGASAKKAPSTPREFFDAHLQAAEAASDNSAKTKELVEAIGYLDKHRFADAGVSVKELWQRVVDVDPEHREAREALGQIKYTGKYEKYAGQWLSREKYADVQTEWIAMEAARKKREAEEAERRRWTKDAFAKKVRKVADFYIKDVAKVPDVDLEFFFDTPEIPKPYLLMVQSAKTPDPEQTAKLIGPGLAALRKQFRADYGEKVLADWDDEQIVVPVMIFKDTASYERYRDNGHKYFPSTGLAAAFYVSSMPLKGIDDFCRGTLYVWHNPNRGEADFYHSVFHEATHQIMHNAAQMDRMPPTPWLEEGIAELWGTYEGNQNAGYKFRRFLKTRFATVSGNAQAYFDWKSKNDPKAPRNWMSLKQLLGITQIRFGQAKRRMEDKKPTAEDVMIVQNVYALGWAFCFWSHYGPGKRSTGEAGKYIDAFRKVVGYELRYRYNRDRLAKCYGIESDEDWEKLNDDFMFFCLRRMRAWNNDMELPELPKKKASGN